MPPVIVFVFCVKGFIDMNLMLQNLNNIRTLRAMAREFSIDVLEEMLEKFRVVTKKGERRRVRLTPACREAGKFNAFLELMKAEQY